jgi:hypothetical protein
MTHHLKLKLNKTELFLVQGKDCPHIDLLLTVEDIVVSQSQNAWNLGAKLDIYSHSSHTIITLCYTTNIPVVARSCRFALYNIRWFPLLTREAAQLLVQTLVVSRLNYAIRSWLDSLPPWSKHCSVSRTLQHTWYSNLPKFSHLTPWHLKIASCSILTLLFLLYMGNGLA